MAKMKKYIALGGFTFYKHDFSGLDATARKHENHVKLITTHPKMF
jgi:hypothetical protein